MRAIILAMLLALGLGLAGAPNASAAPANGAALGAAADAAGLTEQVYHHWHRRHHWHGRHRSHWRWGSRGFGPRCFMRHQHWSSRLVRRCVW
jgi:hypothetical protein